MDKNMFIQDLGSQTTKKPPKARLFNGKWCRYYIAGCIWVSDDGTVAGMSDKKGHIKKLTISSDSNGLYVVCSEFVPSVTLLSGYGKYLPIEDEDIDKWAEEINKKYSRQENLDKIRDSGYDVKDSALDLYNKYLKLLGR